MSDLRVLPERHGRALTMLGDGWVAKTFRDRERFTRELGFYRLVPHAAPAVLDVVESTATIVTQRLPVAHGLPGWRPVAELRALLEDLAARGVHHRDVHTKNVVRHPDGHPLLVDWETATVRSGCPSYDLYGPDRSGIDPPVEHDGYTPQWWGASTRWSIGRAWEAK